MCMLCGGGKERKSGGDTYINICVGKQEESFLVLRILSNLPK